MGILPIGFFAPLPLAIMIPFMAAQSFAMGHAFGTSFQYGKRKISSMTNEEFNALSATDLHGELQADIRAMIPNMNQSFKTMEQFQIDIINSMVNTLKLAAQQFFEWITTGKVSTEQTSTSAYNFGEGGEVTYVQGGSRQEPPGSFIPGGQSYYDYLVEAGVPEAIAKKKADSAETAKFRKEEQIRRALPFKDLKPITKKDTQAISQSAAKKANLISIRDTATRMMAAHKIIYNNWRRIIAKTKNRSTINLAKPKMAKALSLFRDAEKKKADAIRLLRNFR